jgi:class 3 adenylate cyclase
MIPRATSVSSGHRMSDRGEVSRKLVAVFAADVEGYSRLMGADEVGALRGSPNGAADAAASHRRHQRAEIAVAREQNHLVDMLGDSITFTPSSTSILPFIFRRPLASTNSLIALVTTV